MADTKPPVIIKNAALVSFGKLGIRAAVAGTVLMTGDWLTLHLEAPGVACYVGDTRVGYIEDRAEDLIRPWLNAGWLYSAMILGRNIHGVVLCQLVPFDTPLRGYIHAANLRTK